MFTDADGRPREIPPTWLRIGLLVMLSLHYVAPGPVWIQSPWRFIGIAFLLLGGAVLLWAGALFQRAGTGIRPFSPSTRLVQHGPFRFSRNPMYLGMAFVLIGTAVWCGDTTPWLVVPAFVWLIDRRFIAREERFMAERYGDAFADYRARVRRWL